MKSWMRRWAGTSRRIGGLTGALVVVLTAGCQSSYRAPTSASGGPAASPRQHAMLENIPLPVGFELIPERSVAKEHGRLRMAKCEFEGPTPPEQVTRFYQSYMPSAQFRLKTRSLEAGEYKLRFESASEECSIRISRDRGRTVLVVDLGPLPQGSPERSQQPPMPRQQ